MLKESIKYVDYDGNERTEEAYFNLNKVEIMELELGTSGGFSEMLQRVLADNDTSSIIRIIKDLILRSYGKKSLDGKRFEKSEEATRDFSQTEAFANFFMKLITDADAAGKFINGIMPAELVAEAQKELPLN